MSEFASKPHAPAEQHHANTRANTPGRAATTTHEASGGAGSEVAADRHDHSSPPVLGAAADTELRTLLTNMRQSLAAWEQASTQPERDSAIEAIDTRVHLAFDHIPAAQHAAFVRELHTALGADRMRVLGEMLAQPHGGRGRSIHRYLGDTLPAVAPPAPAVAPAPSPEAEDSPSVAPQGDLAAKLCAMAPGMTMRHARQLVPPLQAAMTRYHITAPAQQAMFIAQSMHETGGYRAFCENISAAHAEADYGATTHRGHGLGNTEAGDGARFIGRGALQITGRAAYERASHRIGVDLIANPELAERTDIAFTISAAYWASKSGARRSYFEEHQPEYDWSWIPELENRTCQGIALVGTGAAYDYISLAINAGMPHDRIAPRHEWFTRGAPLFGLVDEGCAVR